MNVIKNRVINTSLVRVGSIECQMGIEESNIDIINNTSLVTVTVSVRSISGSYNSNYSYFEILLDDDIYYKGEINRTVFIPSNEWLILGSHNFTISHKSNGSKSLKCEISAHTTYINVIMNASSTQTISLATIHRYATITKWNVSSIGLTSATFNWETSHNVRYVNKSLNNGSWTGYWGSDTSASKSGTITQTGLAPSTTYNLKIQVNDSASHLWTTGNNVSFTTKPIASISNNSIDINIGSNLTLTFNNYSNNASYLKMQVQKTDGTYVQVTSVTGIQTSSYTWDLSSIISTLYSYVTTRNSMEYRIICGVTLNGTNYENTKSGTMYVVNSNPTFANYAYSNTTTAISNVMGATTMIQNYGNMQVQISTDNKAVAKNNATIQKYVVKVYKSSNIVLTKEGTYSSSSQVNINLGAFKDTGDYIIQTYAVDSRGNTSSTISKSFSVIAYSKPSFKTVSVTRQYDFEDALNLNLSAQISRVTVGSTDKNPTITLKYRYKNVNDSNWGNWTTLTLTSTSTSGTYKIANCVKDYNNFISLSNTSSFDMQFMATDAFYSTTNSFNISQGKAPMYVFEDGTVTVNRIPNFSREEKLQLPSDVLLNINGSDINISDLIKQTILETDKKKYPIGSILMSVVNTNPSSYIGFGTWVAWGSGKVPVGVNTNDANFNTVEKSGGAKTVNLSHTHTVNSHTHTTASHTLTVSEIPAHSHTVTRNFPYGQDWGGGDAWSAYSSYQHSPNNMTMTCGNTGGGQAHSHGNTGSATPGTNSKLSSSQSILQPYITCYMWKRTA